MKQSKSLRSAYETIKKDATYTPAEAVKLMKKHSSVKFDPTAEVHFNLGINPKHAEEQIRSTIQLPHGTGKTISVVAFCGDDKVKAAKDAGAMEAGDEDLLEKVQKGWTDFDAAVATPDMMKKLGKIARVLGPRGLMPNPKAGTVTPDIEKAIKELKGGRLEFRNDKAGIIHTIFGKLSFDDKQLIENLEMMIKTIKEAKPATVKGNYIKSVTINSTMGAGIKINVSEE